MSIFIYQVTNKLNNRIYYNKYAEKTLVEGVFADGFFDARLPFDNIGDLVSTVDSVFLQLRIMNVVDTDELANELLLTYQLQLLCNL